MCRIPTQHQSAAQGRLQRAGRSRRGRRGLAHVNSGLLIVLNMAGDERFQHGMKIGAAESEGAHPGAANAVPVALPGAGGGINVKRRIVEIDIGIGAVEVEARHQGLVGQAERRFQDPGSTCGPFQVPDI